MAKGRKRTGGVTSIGGSVTPLYPAIKTPGGGRLYFDDTKTSGVEVSTGSSSFKKGWGQPLPKGGLLGRKKNGYNIK